MGISEDIFGDRSLLVIRMDMDVQVEIIVRFSLVHSLHGVGSPRIPILLFLVVLLLLIMLGFILRVRVPAIE